MAKKKRLEIGDKIEFYVDKGKYQRGEPELHEGTIHFISDSNKFVSVWPHTYEKCNDERIVEANAIKFGPKQKL